MSPLLNELNKLVNKGECEEATHFFCILSQHNFFFVSSPNILISGATNLIQIATFKK